MGEGISVVVNGVVTFPSRTGFEPPVDEPNARMRNQQPVKGDREKVLCVPNPKGTTYFAFLYGLLVEELRGSHFVVDNQGNLVAEITPSEDSEVYAESIDGDVVITVTPRK